MLRRMLSTVLCICMLVTSLPLQAIAETMPEHEHSYVSETTMEASCSQEGVATYTCDCGDSYTLTVPVVAHRFENGTCLACAQAEPAAETQVTETILALVETPETEPTAAATEAVVEEPLTAETETAPAAHGAAAAGETDSDFTYSIQTQESGEQTVTITGYTGEGGDIVIPSEIDGLPVTKVGSYAFQHHDTLVSVTFSGNVTEFSVCSFYSCRSLKEVILPDGLIRLGNSTFANCTSLERIVIPETVTDMGSSAFAGCTALTDVTLPEGLTSLGEGTFSGCKELKSIDLPQSLTTLGESAFYGCTGLTSITLHEGLTSLGEGVFANCTGLTSIVIPKTVTALSTDTFLNCTGLTSVTLPDTLTNLGNYVFRNCTSLTQIDLPESLTALGDGVFNDAGLTGIVIPKNVTVLKSGVFSFCPDLSEVVLPEGLTAIGGSAFSNCPSLTSITLPESLTSIDSYAFDNCTSLTSVAIPGNVRYLGNNVFSGCTNLAEVTLSEGITGLGGWTFVHCTSLKSIAIPDTVTDMGSGVFSSCTALAQVTLPKGITRLGEGTFSNCTSLTEINLPDTVTDLGDNTFCRSGLQRITLPDSVTNMGSTVFEHCAALTEVKLPAKVTNLGVNTFLGCTGLKTIELPESLQSIGERVFESCTGLTEITLPEGLTSIGSSTFSHCTSLTSITIPESLTVLNNWEFYDCTGLTSVTLPDTLTILDNGVFSGCGSLRTVDLPGSLTRLGDCVFQNCTGLTGIAVPDSVTTIGRETFWGCSNLTEVKLPERLTELGYGAFSNCTSLKEITLPDDLMQLQYASFRDCKNLETVTLPKNLTAIGNNAFSYCTSLQRIEVPAGVETIEYNAFAYCTSLTEVVLAEGLTSIGESAFQNCTALKNITLPNGLTTICNGAFMATGLESIVIPDTVTVMEDSAFAHCSSLKQATLSADLSVLSSHTFHECKALESILLPDSVTSVGYWAFYNCTSLKFVQLGLELNSIDPNAFEGCTNLKLAVWPGSVGEQFAIDNNIPYAYAGNGGSLDVTLDPEVYRGMQLVLLCSGIRRVKKVQEQTLYSFSGLEDGASAQLLVLNAYGKVIETHDISQIYAGTSLELAGRDNIGSLSVTLLDENGNDVTALASVEWFDEAGEPYASGAVLNGLPVGKQFLGRIQLNSQYGQRYHAPEEIHHTVEAGAAALTVTLEPIALSVLSGAVSDGASPIAGAAVVVAQTINDKYVLRTTAVTDKQGFFALEIPAVEAQVTISAHGFRDHTLPLTGLAEEMDIGAVTLEAVTGTVVSVNATLISRVKQGEKADVQQISSLNDLSFAVYNNTRQAAVESVLIQGRTLVLMDYAEPGDELEITVTSLSGAFQPVTGTVTVAEDNRAQWTVELTQYGSILAEFSGTKNESVQMLVYDTSDSLVWSGSTEASRKQIETAALADGTYTVVLMGKASLLSYPNTLSGFDQLELTDGTDYLKKDIAVEAGRIGVCAFGTVPMLNESRFCYTDAAATSFTTSKTTLTAGQFFTLRATAAFAEQYRDQVSDIKWIFQLPEGVEYYDGTLTVSGSADVSYEYSDGLLVIPTEDPSRIVRFCAYATGEGEVTSTAYLEFSYGDRIIRQSVGTAAVKIGMLDFAVTGMTYDPTATILGTAGSNAEIKIYDGDVQIGQVKSSPNGSWSTTVTLYNTKTVSTHNLQAVMRLPSGTEVRSKVHTVNYQFSPNPPSVRTVSMYVGGKLASVFDFANGTVEGRSYSVPSDPTLSFVIAFEVDEMERLSEVTLEAKLTDGTTRKLDAVYSEDVDGFVTSGQFKNAALPVSVGVSYLYDGEFVFSRQDLREREEEQTILEQKLQTLEEVHWKDNTDSLETMEIKSNPMLALPQEIVDQVAKYNEKVASYETLVETLAERYAELYGQVRVENDDLWLEGGIVEISLKKKILTGDWRKDAEARGYLSYPIADMDLVALYSLEISQGEEVLIYVPDSTEYGFCQQSLITEDGVELQLQMGLGKDVTQEDANQKLEDLRKTVGDVKDSYDEAKDSLDKIEESLRRFNENAFDQLVEESKKVEKIPDPIERQQAMNKLNDQLDVLAEYDGHLNHAKKVLDKAGLVGDVLGGVDNYLGFQKDLEDYMEMDRIRQETGSHDALVAQVGLGCRLLAKGAGVGLGVLALGALATPELAAAAAVGGGLMLLGGAADLISDINNTDEKIDDGVRRVKDEYYDPQGITPIIDPSGYIYEAVPSNRLPGVTVTCYEKVTKYDIYDEPYEEVQFWDAEEFEQVNPLITDEQGQYAWDVPVGWWQVKAEKEGYETAYSEWLPVPPPQLEVNLGLVSYAAPEINDVFAQSGSVEVTFSKYLRAETLTVENITVSVNDEEVTGTVELLNSEASPDHPEQLLASRIRFVPAEPLTDGETVKVTVSSSVLSYADVPMEKGKTAEAEVVTIPDRLFAPESIQIAYQGAGTVSLQVQPAQLAAGQTVLVSAASDLFLGVEETSVILDETGFGQIHLTGKLPGETELCFSMSDGRLQARTRVLIQMPNADGSPETAHSIRIAQEYAALKKGESIVLSAETAPQKLKENLFWYVEEGSEKIVSVDASGKVTALNVGTGYILASVSDGETTLTARCRIDVAERLELDGVRLSTDKVTTELYSTDYTKLDILLMLPQNYAAASADNSGASSEKLSAAISNAYFTDPELAALFELKVLDDRTVEIVPTKEGIDDEKLAKNYSGTITVVVEGNEYVTDKLTLNIKTSLPKLKVTIPAFNSFYSGQSQEIVVTGATVTEIRATETPLPEWLSLYNNQLTLTEAVPQKSASGKVSLEIWTEEWAVPICVTSNVKNTYKAPGLKLSASSIQLSDQPGSSEGVNLQLQPKNKKETLSDLKVCGISAPEGFSVVDYRADGTFTLKAESAFTAGKINLEVSFNGTDETVKLPITVKTSQVKLALAKSSISLNAEIGDSALIAITATPADYILSAPSFRLTDNARNDKLQSGELEVCYEDGVVRINTTDKTPIGTNYTLYIKAGGSKEVALKIKTIGGVPSVSLKQSTNLDLSFGDAALVTASFKNYSGGKVAKFDYTVTEMKGKEVINEKAPYFNVESDGSSNFQITCSDPANVDIKNSYTLNLKLTLADGKAYETSLKLKIKRTAIKLKLNPGKLTLNKSVNDVASVRVDCTIKGYGFTRPHWQLMDKSGKQPVGGKLDINWVNGKLVIGTNANTEYGATYKLLVAAEEGAAATALTISILAENKSYITGTMKLTGTLDVIRDGTAVTVTPTFKNCADAERIGTLTVLNGSKEDVTELFNVTEKNGSYLLTRADGAKLDHGQKYMVVLTTDFGNGVKAEASSALKLKMGSAKLTLNTDSTTLFAKDKNSRIDISFSSTDNTLNKVAKVEIKDTKLKEQLEVIDYGNGQYALAFKDGKVPAKVTSVNLPLEVWLEGNETAKANASVKIKITIVR